MDAASVIPGALAHLCLPTPDAGTFRLFVCNGLGAMWICHTNNESQRDDLNRRAFPLRVQVGVTAFGAAEQHDE